MIYKENWLDSLTSVKINSKFFKFDDSEEGGFDFSINLNGEDSNSQIISNSKRLNIQITSSFITLGCDEYFINVQYKKDIDAIYIKDMIEMIDDALSEVSGLEEIKEAILEKLNNSKYSNDLEIEEE